MKIVLRWTLLLLFCTASLFAQGDDRGVGSEDASNGVSIDKTGNEKPSGSERELCGDKMSSSDSNYGKTTLVDESPQISYWPVIILGVLCVVGFILAGAFAFYYFKTLKELEQKDAELRRLTGECGKKPSGSYYDSPASEAPGLSSLSSAQRQSSGGLASAGSSRDSGKDSYSWRNFSDLSPRCAQEKVMPSTASQETFSYSSLFYSSEERAKFSTEGLIYLAISEKTMQQIAEGDKNSSICFDKKQNRIYAEYILIKNKFLVPNYYAYNEAKEMPDLMSIKRVFTIQGRLPGKISGCSPAQVRLTGDKYELVDKGALTVQ